MITNMLSFLGLTEDIVLYVKEYSFFSFKDSWNVESYIIDFSWAFWSWQQRRQCWSRGFLPQGQGLEMFPLCSCLSSRSWKNFWCTSRVQHILSRDVRLLSTCQHTIIYYLATSSSNVFFFFFYTHTRFDCFVEVNHKEKKNGSSISRVSAMRARWYVRRFLTDTVSIHRREQGKKKEIYTTRHGWTSGGRWGMMCRTSLIRQGSTWGRLARWNNNLASLMLLCCWASQPSPRSPAAFRRYVTWYSFLRWVLFKRLYIIQPID